MKSNEINKYNQPDDKLNIGLETEDIEVDAEEIEKIITETFDIHRLDVCGCSDHSIFYLLRKSEKERIEQIDQDQIVGESKYVEKQNIILGLKEIMRDGCLDYEELNPYGQELICWCIDFLLFLLEETIPYTPNKYIVLFSFIYDFLKIKKDSGYDYWLMNYLDNKKFIEHGSGIRCSRYLTNKTFEKRCVSSEHTKLFYNWINDMN